MRVINFPAVAVALASFGLAFLTAGCDQIQVGSRYELSKDEKGRTIRLDKKTGEIAVVVDGAITPLRDIKDAEKSARELERTHKEAVARLGKFKYWPAIPIPQFEAVAQLTTVWRDGEMLYALTVGPVSNKPGAEGHDKTAATAVSTDPQIIVQRLQSKTFTLLLEDTPFQIANTSLSFSRVVDDEGKALHLQARGKVSVSQDNYEKIDSWNLTWR